MVSPAFSFAPSSFSTGIGTGIVAGPGDIFRRDGGGFRGLSLRFLDAVRVSFARFGLVQDDPISGPLSRAQFPGGGGNIPVSDTGGVVLRGGTRVVRTAVGDFTITLQRFFQTLADIFFARPPPTLPTGPPPEIPAGGDPVRRFLRLFGLGRGGPAEVTQAGVSPAALILLGGVALLLIVRARRG